MSVIKYDFSFLSVVFGHSRVLKKLEQSDSVLISIANDHGINDRWVLICSTNKSTQLEKKGGKVRKGPIETKEEKSSMNIISCLIAKIFKPPTEEYDIKPWYKTKSYKDHYLKVSEPKNSMVDLISETKSMSKAIDVSNVSSEFSVRSYSIHNPPKSSKNHSVLAFGLRHQNENQTISQLDECLYLRIYSNRNIPKHSVTEAPRPLLLARLIRKCSVEYCMDETKILKLYNYFSVELDKDLSFSSKKYENVSTAFRRFEKLTFIECLALVKSKEIETNHHGPLLLLLFFESKSIKGFENMQILAKYLLDQMISKESCERA